MKIFLIKQKYLRTYIYPLSIFLKEILEKIQKSIISVKRKLSLLKNIPKKQEKFLGWNIADLSLPYHNRKDLERSRSTVAIIGCETAAKAGFQEVGRREQRNGKSDDNGVATSAFNALTVSLQAPSGVRTVPDALFSKVSVAALQARGSGYGAKRGVTGCHVAASRMNS